MFSLDTLSICIYFVSRAFTSTEVIILPPRLLTAHNKLQQQTVTLMILRAHLDNKKHKLHPAWLDTTIYILICHQWGNTTL